MTKPLRKEHYVAGFGDGSAAKTMEENHHTRLRHSQDYSTERSNNPNADLRYRARQQDRIEAQRLRHRGRDGEFYPASAERWDAYIQDGASTIHRYQNSMGSDQWQYSAFALLASVVLMSALFLHLITEGANERASKVSSSRRRQRTPNRIHKKTDEWVADVDTLEAPPKEQDEASQTEASSESARATPAVPGNIYYNNQYQARLQQRMPQRNLLTSANTPSPMPATAAGTSSSQNTGKTDPFVTQSSYMNPKGTGGMLYRAPESQLRTPSRLHKAPSPSSSRRMSPVDGYDSSAKTPNYSRAENQIANPPLPRGSFHSSNPSTPDYSRPMNPYSISQRAVALETRISSFSSLIGPNRSDSERHIGLDEELGTPEHHMQIADPLDFSSSSSSIAHGTEDVEETERMGGSRRHRKKHSGEMFRETPRMANSRYLLTPGGTRTVPGQVDTDPWRHVGLQPLSSTSSLAFASPPAIIGEHCDEPVEIDYRLPFVPSLGAKQFAPPGSININALRLQQMKSGSSPLWETEQAQIFNETGVLVDGTSATDDKIPSNDPRGGIDHKRKSLVDDTNSTASLQGAIDFDKLELIEVIGGGGFGQVWRAKLRGTPVAVKVLTGSAQGKHVPKAVLEEFAAEINLLKGMQHPNICLYMGACIIPPNRAIVTELAAHGSVWDALRLPLDPPFTACDGISHEGWPLSLFEPDPKHGVPPSYRSQREPPVPPTYTWPWDLVQKVAVGVARGMAYLHGGQPPVLHRDLKSANILLDESYNPKVCDFGLSRLKAQEQSMTGNCGTVQWMAPEVLANESYNEKADVFSYGIICWELLSRQCPYDGMTAIQCALAVLNRDARPEIPKWCPPGLHAVIRSCLKKDQSERPTFEQLISDLDALAEI